MPLNCHIIQNSRNRSENARARAYRLPKFTSRVFSRSRTVKANDTTRTPSSSSYSSRVQKYRYRRARVTVQARTFLPRRQISLRVYIALIIRARARANVLRARNRREKEMIRDRVRTRRLLLSLCAFSYIAGRHRYFTDISTSVICGWFRDRKYIYNSRNSSSTQV